MGGTPTYPIGMPLERFPPLRLFDERSALSAILRVISLHVRGAQLPEVILLSGYDPVLPSHSVDLRKGALSPTEGLRLLRGGSSYRL